MGLVLALSMALVVACDSDEEATTAVTETVTPTAIQRATATSAPTPTQTEEGNLLTTIVPEAGAVCSALIAPADHTELVAAYTTTALQVSTWDGAGGPTSYAVLPGDTRVSACVLSGQFALSHPAPLPGQTGPTPRDRVDRAIYFIPEGMTVYGSAAFWNSDDPSEPTIPKPAPPVDS